jgi:Fe-S-cluster containining protein
VKLLEQNINFFEELLTPDDCAKCRLCCYFSQYEIWETPAIDDELKRYVNEKFPDVRFINSENCSYFALVKRDNTEFFNCPVLTQTGCTLGKDKPFECAVWPFRIMRFDDKFVISVSALCKPMMRNSLEDILKTLENGLENALISHAGKNPFMIKNYTDGYPILKFVNVPAV